MRKEMCASFFAIVALFIFLIPSNAQTYNQDLYATMENVPVFCLTPATYHADGTVTYEPPFLSGWWLYHVSYHVDKRTGEVSKMHWNIKQSHLEDQDGNEYKVIDTGNDNYGGSVGGLVFYDLWNNINAFNEGYDINYDIEDGWIPAPNTTIYEGSSISTFKVIGKNGEKVTFKEVRVYHVNGNGEVVVDFDKIVWDCN